MIHFNKNDLEQDRLVCFLHIPKTGGKTLWNILEKQSEDVLVWHGKFFEELSKPFEFFTFLRDPVDRVLSTFYYIQNYERDPLHKKVKRMNFEEFVEYMKNEDIGDKPYPKKDLRSIRFRTVNLATRYLSGGNPSDIKKAKENLKNYFPVVGFTDMYNESLFLLKEHFNFDISKVDKINTNRKRPKKNVVPKSIIKTIAELNSLDIELYQSAKEEFNNKLNQMDSTSIQKLNQWKAMH
ncbi:sulfotransferase family 2 domain-containing protein [Halobacillus sp. MO56]